MPFNRLFLEPRQNLHYSISIHFMLIFSNIIHMLLKGFASPFDLNKCVKYKRQRNNIGNYPKLSDNRTSTLYKNLNQRINSKHIVSNHTFITFLIHFFRRFVLPESPRWLLCKGRVAEVKTIIRAAAAFNKRPLPDNLDKLLKPPLNDESQSAGVCELFHSKYLRLITFCFLCIWFTMNLVYYGLVLNMNSFGGNIYLNSVIMINIIILIIVYFQLTFFAHIFFRKFTLKQKL